MAIIRVHTPLIPYGARAFGTRVVGSKFIWTVLGSPFSCTRSLTKQPKNLAGCIPDTNDLKSNLPRKNFYELGRHASRMRKKLAVYDSVKIPSLSF
jgi:hypothetical protein